MQSSRTPVLGRIIVSLLILKAVVAVLVAFSTFNLPHTWREIDTIAVSFRYFQRWSLGLDSLPLVPAILSSGTGVGYMPMEFPLFNLIMAPFFMFGPGVGKILASLAIFSIHGLMVYMIHKRFRGIQICGIEAHKAFLLLPILGLPSVFGLKLIPDTFATMMVVLGLGLCWQRPRFLGLIFMSLGVLIKPPAIAAMMLGFLRKDFLTYFKKHALILVLPILPAAFYYTVGISWLKDLQEGKNHFFVEVRPPLESLWSVLSRPKDVFKLFFDQIWSPAALFLLPMLGARQIKLWLILVLQFIIVSILDGEHAFVHNYYFMGMAPTACLIFYSGIKNACSIATKETLAPKYKVILGYLFILIFIGRNLELAAFQPRSLMNEIPVNRAIPFAVCRHLKASLPELPWDQNYGFRSQTHPYPYLGICFGERVAVQDGQYGLFTNMESMPKSCKPLKNHKGVIVAQCF